MTTVMRAPDRSPIAPPPRQSAQRRRLLKTTLWSAVALLPVFVFLGLFQYYPALAGVWFSFWDWKPGGESVFVGLGNFARMLDDEVWWMSFRNLGIILAFGIVSWLLPLLAAELLITVRRERTAFIYRSLLIIPLAFPAVVTALVWQFFYEPNSGVFNAALESIGLGALAQNWTGDPSIAMLSLLLVGFPFIAGLPFLIFYTSLQNVPSEIFEAAALDGVGRIARVWRIDIPLMASQMRVLFFLAVIATLQYGFTAYIVTAGGPDNATMVPILRILNTAFQGQQWGYAAALSTTLFAITLFFSCLVMFVRRRQPQASPEIETGAAS